MKALLIAVTCLGLVACATTSTNTGKGLSAAQDGVAAAAQGVHQAYINGVVSKAQVAQAAKLVDQADDLSKVARSAYATGDVNTYEGAITALASITAQIVALEKPQ